MTILQGKWMLEEASGLAVPVGTIFDFDDKQVRYSYGNQYVQNYDLVGSDVKFGAAIGTKMFVEMQPPESLVVGSFTDKTLEIEQIGDVVLLR
jgi:hypothetical protein